MIYYFVENLIGLLLLMIDTTLYKTHKVIRYTKIILSNYIYQWLLVLKVKND